MYTYQPNKHIYACEFSEDYFANHSYYNYYFAIRLAILRCATTRY